MSTASEEKVEVELHFNGWSATVYDVPVFLQDEDDPDVEPDWDEDAIANTAQQMLDNLTQYAGSYDSYELS